MKHYLTTFLLIVLSACNSINEKSIDLNAKIIIPEEYCVSSKNEFLNVQTDAERYLEMYKFARGKVINEYIRDIHYELSPTFLSDNFSGGWASAVDGFETGMYETNRLIQNSIAIHGKEATKNLLIETKIQ